MSLIPKLAKGKTPTPLETEYFNRIVDLLNALQSLQVSPAGSGKINVGAQAAILDLSPLVKAMEDRISAVEKTTTLVQQLQAAMSNASGTGHCNPDGSISITITFPGI